jgi:hypothetical protein
MEYYPNIKVVVKDVSGEEELMELTRLLPFRDVIVYNNIAYPGIHLCTRNVV